MRLRSLRRSALACVALLACQALPATELAHPDHYEFDATLSAPFAPVAGPRPVVLHFAYPGAGGRTAAAWKLEALSPRGDVLRQWHGLTTLKGQRGRARVDWNADGAALPAGYYTLRLRAVPTVAVAGDDTGDVTSQVTEAMALFADELHEQRVDLMIGAVAPAVMPAFDGLPVGAGARQKAVAADGLDYTIYYGNFHSQTNHSDGGGDLSTCSGSQGPQAGAFGPTDAFAMMDIDAGGDFLLASEHNHMYDGSTSTSGSATPTAANGLFDSGRQLAADYRSTRPGFLSLYGLEWGVISNGGHLNIINPDLLANWEFNSAGQLLGGIETPKSNYPALYLTMRQRGWIGQFNHASTSGQFVVDGIPLGYDANGAEVMVLAEILNTSAFSTNTTETETSRSSYISAWNTLLERGYRLAPATNQDNHCANWGLSFTNRTGVLLPGTSTLGETAFHDALRARRAFATEDKHAQLVLTANGHVMGSSFANSGTLTLTARHASSNGQTVQRVQFFEGVPGRNGTVTQLAEGNGSISITPADGEHFYYALVTQANGLRLWSAPVWVSQGAGSGDTTAPTASASVSGSSGTITLSATASDNVGVANVEFRIDGVLVGSDSSAPYSLAFDSTTLADGSHALVADARDAAGNVGSSAPVAFSVSNTVADTTAPTATASVSGSSGIITLSATAADNVGVANVEFRIDGVLVGSDSSSPYSLAFDSTTLADGSHTLVADAVDAAGNVGSSAPVAFSTSNTVQAQELVANGSFESGSQDWSASKGVITSNSAYPGHSGSYKAWLNGYGSSNTDYLRQGINIPSTASAVTLSFWLWVDSDETTTTGVYDVLRVQVRDNRNKILATLGQFSNLDKGTGYVQRSFDLSAFRGKSVRIYFEGVEGSRVATSFIIDDVSVSAR